MPSPGGATRIRRAVMLAGPAALVVMMTACASESPAPSPSPSASQVAQLLPGGCSDDAPCQFKKGSYELSTEAVVPGLRVTLPAGWTAVENDSGELNLIPAAEPEAHLFVWTDMSAVKSTGAGHGVTVLQKVGRSAASLLAWVDHNSDLKVSAASSRTIAGIPMSARVISTSPSARYGDPGCPDNPTCADLFTRVGLWGSNYYGIGGTEQALVYFGSLPTGRSFMVALDSSPDGMKQLRSEAEPIIASLRTS